MYKPFTDMHLFYLVFDMLSIQNAFITYIYNGEKSAWVFL